MSGFLNELNKVTSYDLHHHAIKIGDNRYYSVFIVDRWRHEVETSGTQEEAMKEAYSNCLHWLEKVIDTTATFRVDSNAKEIATIQSGRITLVDVDLLTVIEKTIELSKREKAEEIKKAERLGRKLAIEQSLGGQEVGA